MATISTNTFGMGQKHPLRHGAAMVVNVAVNGSMTAVSEDYQDYSFRDFSRKCRLRKWEATFNTATLKWTVVKRWTTALPGEPQYIRAPRKIENALLTLIHRQFPNP